MQENNIEVSLIAHRFVQISQLLNEIGFLVGQLYSKDPSTGKDVLDASLKYFSDNVTNFELFKASLTKNLQ